MALTAAITLLIPETKGRSIAEIEKGVLYGENISSGSDTDVPVEREQVVDQRFPIVGGDQKPAFESA